MADEFTCTATLPVELDARAGDDPLRSRIPVAELGTFSDPRYGRIAITQEKVTNWQKLLAAHFHGRVPVDFDHNTDKAGPTGSKAAAWIVGLDQNGQDGDTPDTAMVWATVEWTPPGEEAVRNREYLYISPTFVDQLADKRGHKLGPALLRAALTNNPFLHDMPAVSLSGREFATREEAGEGNPDPADSRPAMADLTKIAEALGLDKDADEATILAAATDVKAKADTEPETPEPKTLEAQATDAGKVLLGKDEVAELKANAAAGKQASDALAEQRFTVAYDKALSEGRVATDEDTKTFYREIYELDADKGVAALDKLPKLVNLERGSGAGAGTSAETSGVDLDDREAVDEAVKTYMAEHDDVNYVQALDKVITMAGAPA